MWTLENALRELVLRRDGRSGLECLLYAACWTHGPASIAALAAKVGVTRHAAARACRSLAQGGWMLLNPGGRSIRPVATMPSQYQERLAAVLVLARDAARNKGEFLMKRFLTARVASDQYVDSAGPEYLTSPVTKELLELDRYYFQAGVAFEFNGPQHTKVTARHPSERELDKTIQRDAIKKGLCQDNGIRLVVITAEQLHPDILETLIPASLPRRLIDFRGPYYRELARLCANYARAAKAPPEYGQR